MAKHLLVFGGSGFVGSALCALALKENIPVVSISRHGQPKDVPKNLDHPLMTWVAADIFNQTDWHHYFENAYAIVNLIGIIRENFQHQQTFVKDIYMANYQLVQVAKNYPKLPFLFLSANAGGPFISPYYLANKERAEASLKTLNNPVIIFKPGLVVSPQKPTSLIAAAGISFLSYVPLTGATFRKVKPISRKRLVARVLAASFYTNSQTLRPTEL